MTAVWLVSALAVGAGAGVGVLQVVNHKTVTTVATAWPYAATPQSPTTSATPTVAPGVRSDGTHFGSIHAFLLPMPSGFSPGPDDSDLGNDSQVTAAEIDAQVGGLFSKLQKSDLSSAQGAMEAAHMKDGALRTYRNATGTVDIELTVLQLDPTVAAKQTADFQQVVTQSSFYRAGPAVPGYPNAKCVLPATYPGDKIDQMICLATVGDMFVMGLQNGTVPMDQTVLTGMFASQLDLLKKGVGK